MKSKDSVDSPMDTESDKEEADKFNSMLKKFMPKLVVDDIEDEGAEVLEMVVNELQCRRSHKERTPQKESKMDGSWELTSIGSPRSGFPTCLDEAADMEWSQEFIEKHVNRLDQSMEVEQDANMTCKSAESADEVTLSPISKLDASAVSMDSATEAEVEVTSKHSDILEEVPDEETWDAVQMNVEDIVDRFEKTSKKSAVDPIVICGFAKKQEMKDKYRYRKSPENHEIADVEVEGNDLYVPHFWELEESLLKPRSSKDSRKLRVHINEVGQWDSLACNKPSHGHVYLGSDFPEGRKLCEICLRNRPELMFLQ